MMRVKIWGTRGSLAAPYPDRMKYGGNTSCVSVQCNDQLVVFDAGTGIRELGKELEKQEAGKCPDIHLFFGHKHLDHICGFPFFPLLFRKDCRIHLYGEGYKNQSFRSLMNLIAGPPLWPLTPDQCPAELVWHEIHAGEEIRLKDDLTIRTLRAAHPDETMIFRLEHDAVGIVYGLDYEIRDESVDNFISFSKNCSLLIFDGMYTKKEYEISKGYGHSCWEMSARLCARIQAEMWCVSHHEWGRTDEELDRMQSRLESQNRHCFFAREGMTFEWE